MMSGKLRCDQLFRFASFYNSQNYNCLLLKPAIHVLTDNKMYYSNSSESRADSEDIIETRAPLFPKELLVSRILKNTDPSIDYGSIYKKCSNAHDALIGTKAVRRVIWEEQDCTESFPGSPEEANLDVRHYIEQRDMWERRKILNIPKFCIGSIIAVTRGDQWSDTGFSRFVGICIHINPHRNTKGHLFVIRNVIMGEALEIQYPFYNPLIQKIEVLRHQYWENEMPFIGLRFLRDYPLEYSTIDEKMEAEEYNEEPSVRKWTSEDKEKIVNHFDDIYESRRRR